MTTTVVSAPGKVLLAGGYLVLDRKYQGLVFGLDARIHACVRVGGKSKTDTSRIPRRITVRSPQFREACWVYLCESLKDGVRLRQTEEGSSNHKNPFVETTLSYVLTYLCHLPIDAIGDLDITILADDDYYSNPARSKKGFFSDFGIPLTKVHKTGLGSSAALVTALTAALVATFLPASDNSGLASRRDVIHNLAQTAHCAAQGKIGSGFDVAAAVYGSCLYRKFTPKVISYVGETGSDGFGERLHRCVENLEPDHPWDTEILQHIVQIPNQLRLVLCDVDCGSETPGMVKQVLAWKEHNAQEADLLWTALQRGTHEICEELGRLSRLEGIAELDYQNLADVISTIRSLRREMSEKSGVPIEPPAQTQLLNACSAVPGVVGGVVPGAGGFDAVVLLVENNETTLEALKNLLDGWIAKDTKPNVNGEPEVKLLTVKQDSHGIRSEPAESYAGWLT